MGGILPEEAPDPRTEWVENQKLIPIPVVGFMPQPSLEETDAVGLSYGLDDGGYSEMTASITYTLWRNPGDRSDPVNLVDLDEKTLRSIKVVPPWTRPVWLIEYVERLPTRSCGRPCEPPGIAFHPSVPRFEACWLTMSATSS